MSQTSAVLAPNDFKAALCDGKPQIGLWSAVCSNIVAEMNVVGGPVGAVRWLKRYSSASAIRCTCFAGVDAEQSLMRSRLGFAPFTVLGLQTMLTSPLLLAPVAYRASSTSAAAPQRRLLAINRLFA